MADDVTKKDLQGVEARLNKQIGELKKDLEKLRKDWLADSEELNKIQVNIRTELDARLKEIEPKIKEFQGAINEHAKAITELQNRKTSLF